MSEPRPYLDLADGWGEQAKDLRQRAENLTRRSVDLRSGVEELYPGDPRPDELDAAADHNIILATVLEQCAWELRDHHRLVGEWTSRQLDEAMSVLRGTVAVDPLGNPRGES